MDSEDKVITTIGLGIIFAIVIMILGLTMMSQKYYKDKDIRHLEQELRLKQIEVYGELENKIGE